MNEAPRQEELRRLLDAGYTAYRAAQIMGITQQAVSSLLRKLRSKGYIYPKSEEA